MHTLACCTQYPSIYDPSKTDIAGKDIFAKNSKTTEKHESLPIHLRQDVMNVIINIIQEKLNKF